ncbi:hypothetical protein ATI61_10969 [Archangium gephyra]|uniref:Uncharacterized protein n=2 Tax=Archangium gephyra TaxID=48 RepID=A0AAC8Q2B3_9BACT|nr:Hypothetical protein AA314_01361 [Archangium gephyra]REG27734.1 hypothetical protein ATI61_10969 [Archangium gephyra]
MALAVVAVLGAGCGGGGLTPEEQERWVGSYRLPQDGVENNNAPVGPFCCSGKTLLVREPEGEGVLGYAHFYSWEGQAYNFEGGSGAPDVLLRLSGRTQLDAGVGEEEMGHIAFTAAELKAGASKRQRVGALEYLVTVDRVETLDHDGRPYFRMDSLEVSVDVLRVKD